MTKKFLCSDLGLATTLKTLEITLLKLNRSKDSKKIHFVFDNTNNKTEELAKAYWQDELKVNPRTYFDNQRLLKNRLYNN